MSFTSSGNSPSTAGQITLSYGTASSTTVNASSASSLYGQSVRLTAAVDPSDGGGTVTFTSDGIAIPGCTNLSFEAGGGTDWLTSCTTSSLWAGTHTVIATYSGDRDYTGSSASTTVTVEQATSSTAVHASSVTSTSGQPVTFNASVDPSDGGGAVTFRSDGSSIPGCISLSLAAASGSGWTASCTTSSLSAGTHTITASYAGAVNYTDSSASTTETVQQATSTSLTATPSTLLIQRTDKLVATVRSSDGGGTVAFTNNGAPLSGCGAVALKIAAGAVYQAVCNRTFLSPGTYSILASYSGDTGSAPSSASATVHVNPAPVVSSVSPNAGPTDGGQTVTIGGWDLSGATKVSFGTTVATNVTIVSDSQLTATVPAHAAGAGPGDRHLQPGHEPGDLSRRLHLRPTANGVIDQPRHWAEGHRRYGDRNGLHRPPHRRLRNDSGQQSRPGLEHRAQGHRAGGLGHRPGPRHHPRRGRRNLGGRPVHLHARRGLGAELGLTSSSAPQPARPSALAAVEPAKPRQSESPAAAGLSSDDPESLLPPSPVRGHTSYRSQNDASTASPKRPAPAGIPDGCNHLGGHSHQRSRCQAVTTPP